MSNEVQLGSVPENSEQAVFDHLTSVTFDNSLDRLVDKIGDYVSYLFMISVAISFYEIVSRYFFNAPTIWVHETTIMICALSMAYGGPYCLARNTHISIKMVYDAVSERTRRWLDVLNGFLAVFYCALIAYAGYIMTEKSLFTPTGMFRLETSGSAWNPITPAIVKNGLFLILVLMTTQSVIRLISAIKRKVR
jgi:TRAP-type C4-dicarboxylate transport system permease small subunit